MQMQSARCSNEMYLKTSYAVCLGLHGEYGRSVETYFVSSVTGMGTK